MIKLITGKIKQVKALIILLFLILFSFNSLNAYQREDFLFHGPSVAAFGRGEAGTALFDDVSSVFYNPALASGLDSKNATLAFYSLFDGSTYSYAGFGLPLGKNNFGAVSLIDQRSGTVELRQNINDNPTDTQTNQYAGIFSFAHTFQKLGSMNAGIDLRCIYYDMDGYHASGVGADVGVSKNIQGLKILGNKSEVDLGFAVQNLVSPSITMISEAETYPMLSRLSAAIKIPTVYHAFTYDELIIGTDLIYQEYFMTTAVGVEYRFIKQYIFKAGYYDDHLTIGAGYRISRFHIDYAYDLSDFANLQRLSVSYFFGNTFKKNEKNTLISEAKQSLAEDKKRRNEAKALLKEAMHYYDIGYYLKATDLFKDIIVKYPEYDENARIYINKINEEMSFQVRNNEADIEKVSYAGGYVGYQKADYGEAVNAWKKVLQLNPKRNEVIEYMEKVSAYMADAERLKKEKALADQASKLLDDGISAYNSSKWVSCIKFMEQIKDICGKNSFPGSFDVNQKAEDYINKSVERLSKALKEKGKPQESQKEAETDPEGADKHYQEGLILYAQGKSFDAEKEWELAIRLNPNHIKAQKALNKLREEQ